MKEKIYYFSATHWDREWYQTFQGFRLKLIRVVDDLIQCLESRDDILCFHFDGQTIVLDDYLEICPENRERLARLIAQQRILIGPWYCMPDENLVSGEALIRNLQKGIAKCAEWGTPFWPMGDLCDTFGHTPQMPQILRGFGIRSAILGRGTNDHTTPAFFRWQSPDGSEVFTFKIPDACGYGAFSMEVCGQAQKGSLVPPDSDAFRDALSRYLEHERARANLPVLILWDGMDHEPIHHDIPAYLDAVRRLCPDAEVAQANLADVAEELEACREALPLRSGELLETARAPGPHLHLLTHALSSRPSIKQRNDACQALLEKNFEPLLAYFSAHGIRFRERILDTAWQHLLQNHPHDSICGCSVDRVHDEMGFRFSQVESITEAVVDEGTRTLAQGMHILGRDADTITVLHPSPYPHTDTVELTLPFDPAYPKWSEPFGYQDICAFRLFDAQGREVPYSIARIQTGALVRVCSETMEKADLYTLSVPLEFPGLGSVSLRVVPQTAPVRTMGRIVQPDGSLENEFLRVCVQADGRITLLDKTTGQSYSDLLGLADHGELGDGWNSVAPVEDQAILGGTVRQFSVCRNDGLCGEVSVEMTMELPACVEMEHGHLRRSRHLCSLPVRFSLSLLRGERRLRVGLDVDNCVRDHVLRLLLPTGISGPYEANAAFTFVRRTPGVDASTADWKECAKLEKPMHGILLRRRSNGTGLAFLSQGGLHECGGDDDARGTLSVTLLRSFAKTHTTNGEPGGQELFSHHYRFDLIPLDSTISPARLQQMQDLLQCAPVALCTSGWTDDTLLSLRGAVVSALRPIPNGLLLRVFQPEDHETMLALDWHGASPITEILECDLNGTVLRTREVPPPNGAPVQEIRIPVPAQKILTLHLRLESSGA